MGRFFAFQIGEGVNVFILLIDDQHRFRRDIGDGKVILSLALGSNRNLVDHCVIAVGIQTCYQTIPFAFHKLGFHPDPLRDFTGDIDVKPHQLSGRIMVSKRRESPFGANFKNARRFYLRQVVLRPGRMCDAQLNGASQQCGH